MTPHPPPLPQADQHPPPPRHRMGRWERADRQSVVAHRLEFGPHAQWFMTEGPGRDDDDDAAEGEEEEDEDEGRGGTWILGFPSGPYPSPPSLQPEARLQLVVLFRHIIVVDEGEGMVWGETCARNFYVVKPTILE